MDLPRPLIWILTGVYALCFAGFVFASSLALLSGGYAYEYEMFGVGLPKALGALLVGGELRFVSPAAI